MKNTQLYDKIMFLATMLAGMAFLIVDKSTGVSQTVGIAVIIGGLIGMISAHSMQAVFTLLEKGFLSQNLTSISQAQQQQSQQKSL
jgi:urea transporter